MKNVIVLLVLTFSLFSCKNSKSKTIPIAAEQKTEKTIDQEIEPPKELKIPLYSKIPELRNTLSKNGIGTLGVWKSGYSSTDYHKFGSSSSSNGMQNNIAYYINGRGKSAEEVKIVLNINNPNQAKEALAMLKRISKKTLKSLNLVSPKGLSKSILNQEPNEFENDFYRIKLKLVKSKIDTWSVIIYSK